MLTVDKEGRDVFQVFIFGFYFEKENKQSNDPEMDQHD